MLPGKAVLKTAGLSNYSTTVKSDLPLSRRSGLSECFFYLKKNQITDKCNSVNHTTNFNHHTLEIGHQYGFDVTKIVTSLYNQ